MSGLETRISPDKFLREFANKIDTFKVNLSELSHIIRKYELVSLTRKNFTTTLFEFIPEMYFDYWKPYSIPEKFGWTDRYNRSIFESEKDMNIEIDRVFHDPLENEFNICEASISVYLTKNSEDMDKREELIRMIEPDSKTKLYFFTPISSLKKLLNDERFLGFMQRRNSRLVLTEITRKEYSAFCNEEYRSIKSHNNGNDKKVQKYANKPQISTF